MLALLMYINAALVSAAFVVGALIKIGELFRSKSQEKNDENI